LGKAQYSGIPHAKFEDEDDEDENEAPDADRYQSLLAFPGSSACGQALEDLNFSLTWLTRLFISICTLNTLFWMARFVSLT
jgi:hypothetical protein